MQPKFEPPNSIKNAENKRKHGITLYEARKAFDDPDGFLEVDKTHSIKEPRFFWYGKIKARVCLVRFTIRSGKIRIFGAGFFDEKRLKFMKSSTEKKAPNKRKKPLFGRDGYQNGGPNSENRRAATDEEARAVGEALGRGPVPTSKRTL